MRAIAGTTRLSPPKPLRAAEIEWAKVSNVHPDDYARVAAARGRSVGGHDHATVARVFGTYEDVKRDQGRMDMEDVLLFAAGVLASDERVAAQVRRQYKWFVVDEFQDVSPLQSALLDLWLGGRDELVELLLPCFDPTAEGQVDGVLRRGVPARRVGGRLVTTVFDLLAAQFGVRRDDALPGEWPAGYDDPSTPCTPAWQEQFTGVPAAKAERIWHQPDQRRKNQASGERGQDVPE